MVKRFGVNAKQVHLDSSSFCVQGEYLNFEPENDSQTNALSFSYPGSETQESEEPIPIEITHGYSRDRRPDLKEREFDDLS